VDLLERFISAINIQIREEVAVKLEHVNVFFKILIIDRFVDFLKVG